ncbi:hypothetical protein ACFL6P_00710 [Candidatus Latescibacterota bacterium]
MRGQTKQQRFKRIAEKRVQRVLDSLRSLSQCSNKRMYEWEDDQLQKIWSAIENEIAKSKSRFENARPEEFRL